MPTADQPISAGVDVSKETLVVAYYGTKKTRTHNNDQKGRAKLIDEFCERKPKRIVVEATGGYERPLCIELIANQLPLDLVNPRRARDFAKSTGALAKTDEVDARKLAAFGKAIIDEPRRIPDISVLAIQQLMVRRDQLRSMIATEKNHLELANDSARESVLRAIEWLKEELASIDQEIGQVIQDNATWHELDVVMKVLKGVGDNLTRTLIAFLPELGDLSSAEAGSLTGTAPLNCDSGKMRGKRRIYGGRKRVREALYMAAMSATHSWSPFHHFYKRLRARDKPHNVAIIAVARKIIVTLNAIVKQYKKDPSKIRIPT